MMKLTKYVVGALAAVALTACSKDEGPGKPGADGVVEGLPATVSFSLKQASTPGTYATDNGTTEEGKLETAQLFIFNSANVLEYTGRITGGSTVLDNIQITSGMKNIFVAVNFDAAATDDGTTVPEADAQFTDKNGDKLKATVGTLTYNTLLDAYADLDEAKLATATTANKFWMTNVGEATVNSKYPTFAGNVVDRITVEGNKQSEVQPFTVNIGRIVSKVKMDKTNINLNMDPTLVDIDEFKTLTGEVVFQMANNPKKTYLLERYLVNDKVVLTPYYEGTYNAGNYFRPTEYKEADQYIPENSHKSVARGAVPCMVIRLPWCPADGVVFNATDGTQATYSKGTTFWAPIVDGKVQASPLFVGTAAPEEDVYTGDAFKLEAGTQFQEYTDGLVYYFVWLEDQQITSPLTAKYMAVRNYMYNVHVNNINGIGSGSGEITDPDQPVVSLANISVTVSVQPWTVKDINTDLQ